MNGYCEREKEIGAGEKILSKEELRRGTLSGNDAFLLWQRILVAPE